MNTPIHGASDLEHDRGSRNWGRLLLLPVLIALGIAAIFIVHLDRYLTFDVLAANRAWLLRQVTDHLLATILVFAAVYVAATTLSLPGSSILTMTAGFLFGTILGTAVAVIAATLGATLLFVVARTSLGEAFRDRTQGALVALREGFRKNAFNYLLFLRLVPLFPFWLINLVAAFLEVPLRIFVLGTLIGIIPGAAVYASVGSGLGSVLDRGQKPDLGIILSPAFLVPILALATLSLAPIIYRRLRRR
ncbi:MAG: TVP38/TMEM64 family protein [Alphaproteobacteria bacterium]|nr:TVP38/TMEM64 family protein [Alphaproteobacteria bacterium]